MGAPAPQTIPAALRHAVDHYADAPAYREADQSLSFADLLDNVRRTAAAYVAAGLPVGGRVGIWAPNSTKFVVAALAVTWAGGVLVPLNSRYTAAEVTDILCRTEAHLVVVADGFLGRSQIAELQHAGDPTPVLDLASIADWPSSDVDLSAANARASAVQPDHVADILFTSGTTGRSKGAMSAHRQSIGVAAAWAEIGGVRQGDRYAVVNPFFHSFGYKVGILVGLLTGACLYPLATFDPAGLAELIEAEQITVLPGAPTIFQQLLDHRGDHDLSSLRLAVTGAASIPVVLIERMRSADGLAIDQVLTAFGMTEAVVVTMCRGDEPAEVVASTCGRAIPRMETRIDGAATPGDEGELLVRGPFVMLGYLDDPDATAEAIDSDGWLHTGDVGTLDPEGNLRITDRIKDMYICGGFNVYPAEVEQVLLRHPDIADCAVIGAPDHRLGEVGHAFVVRRDPGLTEAAVIAHARISLANFKIPRKVTFVDTLPRNAMGKVLKTDLRKETA